MKYSKWYLTTPFYSNITSLCDASIWTLQEESEKDSTLLWKKDSAESPALVVDSGPIGFIHALNWNICVKPIKSERRQQKLLVVNIDLWVSFIFTPPKFHIAPLKELWLEDDSILLKKCNHEKSRPYFPWDPGSLLGIHISWFMKQTPHKWAVFHPQLGEFSMSEFPTTFPTNPIFPTMARSHPPKWIDFHQRVPEKGLQLDPVPPAPQKSTRVFWGEFAVSKGRKRNQFLENIGKHHFC